MTAKPKYADEEVDALAKAAKCLWVKYHRTNPNRRGQNAGRRPSI